MALEDSWWAVSAQAIIKRGANEIRARILHHDRPLVCLSQNYYTP